MATLPQGLPEVPSQADDWQAMRRFLVEMRKAVKRLEQNVTAPRQVTNLSATGKAGGIFVQFSRTDGDSYFIYRNTTASVTGAVRFELGDGATFTDDLAASDETRYYWVEAKRNNLSSGFAGPVSATSLPLTTEVDLPQPPPSYGDPGEDPNPPEEPPPPPLEA